MGIANGNGDEGRSRRPVLLVEDDDGVRRSLQLMLHWRGYDVRSFPAMDPTLADPQAREVDLLIADFVLPDGDGILLLDRLRAAGWRGRSALVTAHGSASVMQAAHTHGYDAVFEKPVAQAELTRWLTDGST